MIRTLRRFGAAGSACSGKQVSVSLCLPTLRNCVAKSIQDEAAAWKDERILTKALLRYNKVIPKRNDADARTAAEIAKQVRTRSVAKATRRQRTRAAQGQSKQQAPKRTTQSTRPTQEQQDVLDNEINEPTVRRIARTGLNHLQSQAHQMQDWATNRLNRQNQ